MFNFITKYFAKATVDAILSTFTKTIKDLEAHAEAKLQETVDHVQKSTEYQALAQLATAEQLKAQKAIVKLKALFE